MTASEPAAERTPQQIVRFRKVFGVPDFLEPWLDRFFEPPEYELVLALADLQAGALPESDPCSGASGRGFPPVSRSALREALPRRLTVRWSGFLAREYRRGIIDLLPGGKVRPSDFHARYEVWALFEGWKDVPAEVRTRLNEWERAHYRERKREQIEARKAGREPAEQLENEVYLLLDEAEAVLEQVERVYLWPCNCRAMEGRCDKPLNVCLRFENDRGLGWEISKERAKEVLREANRAGLMQTGELVRERGRLSGAICNCCADCCFPHQVAEELGARKIWPRSRYVAAWNESACSACGRCARRCPFGAFQKKGSGKEAIVFDSDICVGCGVCLTGCPEGAILMRPLTDEKGQE
ncbi:MAG: hypothetical protein Kow00129_01350 [Thermoleophilia bacterium]